MKLGLGAVKKPMYNSVTKGEKGGSRFHNSHQYLIVFMKITQVLMNSTS